MGFDATFNHSFNSINRIKFQNEMYLQDRDAPFIESEETEMSHSESFRENPWGFYSLLDYRLAERWSTGARFDLVQAVNRDAESSRSSEQAWNAYLTFHQSEFARWRFHYQHLNFEQGGDDNRIFLQGTFAIGVHKHQLQ